MRIVVFANRFERGSWRDWEHACNEAELDAIEDSAYAKASEHIAVGSPHYHYTDYLEGARYIFNVARGRSDRPAEGDTEVYGVKVNEIVIAVWEYLERHFVLKLSA